MPSSGGRGERSLIAALRGLLPEAPESRVPLGSGDDAAIVIPAGAALVLSTDSTVDGVHALRGHPLVAPADIGWRALTTALSDIAAMGVPAGEAVVALVAPPDASTDELLAIGAGLAEAATAHGVAVVGGDVVSGAVLSLTVTVTGWVPSGARAVSRAGARPGEGVWVTGELGGASAGLAAVRRGDASSPHLDRYRRPPARLAAGRELAALGASALIDLSDGLATDARHVGEASGVRLVLDLEAVPLAAGLDDPLAAATGGEDFELLCALPADVAAPATVAGLALTRIGTVGTGDPGLELRAGGVAVASAAGFEHRVGTSPPS